jgi:thymidylate synthase (FAD)
MEVTNEMTCELVDHMGSDVTVVNAARRSMRVTKEEWSNAETGLVRSLIKNGHGSPFEFVTFMFDVDIPIFVAREVFRHRNSSFNEESARYKARRNKMWLPSSDEWRTQVGNAMSYEYKEWDGDKAFADTMLRNGYEDCIRVYNTLLERGVAREIARTIIPVGNYTSFLWKVDLRNLTNFLVLRNAPQAQYEIQKMAKKVEEAFQEVCPNIYSIWNEEGRPRLAAADE